MREDKNVKDSNSGEPSAYFSFVTADRYTGQPFRFPHTKIEAYIIVKDFYTEELWRKLPIRWTNVLERLTTKEIAYFLFKLYAPPDENQTTEKLHHRAVWPLELLAFIATCHALNLNHQKPGYLQNTRPGARKTTSDFGGVCEVENKAGGKMEDEPNGSQKMNLHHIFRCNVKIKKQHEIYFLSKVICDVSDELKCKNIVDVGSGVGHLSRFLSKGCNLNVVAVERNEEQKTRIGILDSKVGAKLEKQNTTQDVSRNNENQGSLIHIRRHIDLDVSPKDFVNDILPAFKSIGIPSNLSEFIIVGLHTCGDLASTALRIFSQSAQVVGVVLVGCCYRRLTIRSETCLTGAQLLGYPMSDYVTSRPGHEQEPNGLESGASHAFGQYYKKLLTNCPNLKLHHYRALLELLLKRKNPNQPDMAKRQIRRLKAEKAARMTIQEYIKTSCAILGVDCPHDSEIQRVEECHRGEDNHVVIFYILRLLLAPLIEGLILVDRLLYIKENNPGIEAKICVLFDRDRSPRNMAIIAKKKK